VISSVACNRIRAFIRCLQQNQCFHPLLAPESVLSSAACNRISAFIRCLQQNQCFHPLFATESVLWSSPRSVTFNYRGIRNYYFVTIIQKILICGWSTGVPEQHWVPFPFSKCIRLHNFYNLSTTISLRMGKKLWANYSNDLQICVKSTHKIAPIGSTRPLGYSLSLLLMRICAADISATLLSTTAMYRTIRNASNIHVILPTVVHYAY